MGRHGPAAGISASGYEYRPALDGVRALAVAAVLAFHGGLAALPGGFLGVDAFFVLSGFLITSLLLGEHARTGRVRLVAFWGRRARRLLPALLLLLVVVALMGRRLVPAQEFGALRTDELAALGYVANWRMTYRGGDYFTATAAPSPLQHTWSLGIEEQFYLLWPLVVGVLLWHLRTRSHRILVGLALAGAAGSALSAALLYAPEDVDRAYYGTDTRAAALLVGCALAVLMAGRESRANGGAHVRRAGHRWLGAFALVGAAAVGWLWAHATGSAPWLYRGGLLAGALAVAAVIAHAVASPGSPTGRLLALPPLVWLGRISYGVYLWHWPLFGWLNADRTGWTGTRLFAARCAVTIGVATLSYLVVERPIRTGTWLRATPWRGPAVAAGALAATAAVAVVATVPPELPAPASGAPGMSVSATPSGSAAAAKSPMLRPGRKPGPEPRITFLGDSVSWSLGSYLPKQPGLTVTVRSVSGCGIARLPDIRYIGTPHTNYEGCEKWDAKWRAAVKVDDPDLAVILLDRWELMDRRLNGEYGHVGQPDFDAYLSGELDLALSIAAAGGAHVVLLTAPYTRRAERPDGGLWPEDEPARVDAWNRLLRTAAQARPGQVSLVDLKARVCPDGRFTWDAGGVRIRSDGLHFTPEGVQRWIAPWLVPRLAQLAVHGPD